MSEANAVKRVEHTPGPWEIEIGDDSNRVCFHDGNRVAITHSGVDGDEPWNVTIAEVWPTTGDADIADGRLIAAAPEMLAALKSICDGACWSLGGRRSHLAEIPAAKIEAARAIIAEAEGKC